MDKSRDKKEQTLLRSHHETFGSKTSCGRGVYKMETERKKDWDEEKIEHCLFRDKEGKQAPPHCSLLSWLDRHVVNKTC